MRTDYTIKGFKRADFFESLTDLDDYLKKTEFNPSGGNDIKDDYITAESSVVTRMSNKGWYGPSFEHCLDIFESGKWIEGAERLNKLASGLALPKAKSVRRRRTRGDFGNELDIHRVYSGQLDRAWDKTVRDKTKTGTRQITIACSVANNVSVDAGAFFWRGAAALKLADSLEDAGYRVQIIAYEGCRGLDEYREDDYYFSAIRLKPFESMLDKTALAASLCLAGFFRIRIFELRAKIKEVKFVSQGLGCCEHHIPPAEHLDASENAIITIPGDLSSEGEARRWLAEQFKDFE